MSLCRRVPAMISVIGALPLLAGCAGSAALDGSHDNLGADGIGLFDFPTHAAGTAPEVLGLREIQLPPPNTPIEAKIDCEGWWFEDAFGSTCLPASSRAAIDAGHDAATEDILIVGDEHGDDPSVDLVTWDGTARVVHRRETFSGAGCAGVDPYQNHTRVYAVAKPGAWSATSRTEYHVTSASAACTSHDDAAMLVAPDAGGAVTLLAPSWHWARSGPFTARDQGAFPVGAGSLSGVATEPLVWSIQARAGERLHLVANTTVVDANGQPVIEDGEALQSPAAWIYGPIGGATNEPIPFETSSPPDLLGRAPLPAETDVDVPADGVYLVFLVELNARTSTGRFEYRAEVDRRAPDGTAEQLGFAPALTWPGRPSAWSMQGEVYLQTLLGDFTGDGRVDLALVTRDGGEVLLMTQGEDGRLGAPVAAPGVQAQTGYGLVNPELLQKADLDGDGADDLVVATSAGTAIFFGGPDGLRAGPTSPETTAAVVDVNGDGHLDLVQVRKAVSWPPPAVPAEVVVRFGDGAGGFADPVDLYALPADDPYSSGRKDLFVAAGDLDGDGVADLALVAQTYRTSRTLTLVLGNGVTTTVNLPTPSNEGSDSVTGLRIRDLDGDGRAELEIVATYEDLTTTRWFWHVDGAGKVIEPLPATWAELLPGALAGGYLLEGDLDGDGRVDPIGYGDRLLTWQTQTAPLAFTGSERVVSSHGFVPYAGGSLGDLDGDGCLDAVFPEHTSMGVIVFYGEGCGR